MGPVADLGRAWAELVEKYTACKLTVYTDKLVAVASLAGEMKGALSGADVYLAGMWRHDLHKQLLWSVEEFPDPDDDGGHASRQHGQDGRVPCAELVLAESARGKIKPDESYGGSLLGCPTVLLC